MPPYSPPRPVHGRSPLPRVVRGTAPPRRRARDRQDHRTPALDGFVRSDGTFSTSGEVPFTVMTTPSRTASALGVLLLRSPGSRRTRRSSRRTSPSLRSPMSGCRTNRSVAPASSTSITAPPWTARTSTSHAEGRRRPHRFGSEVRRVRARPGRDPHGAGGPRRGEEVVAVPHSVLQHRLGRRRGVRLRRLHGRGADGQAPRHRAPPAPHRLLPASLTRHGRGADARRHAGDPRSPSGALGPSFSGGAPVLTDSSRGGSRKFRRENDPASGPDSEIEREFRHATCSPGASCSRHVRLLRRVRKAGGHDDGPVTVMITSSAAIDGFVNSAGVFGSAGGGPVVGDLDCGANGSRSRCSSTSTSAGFRPPPRSCPPPSSPTLRLPR